MDSWRYYNYALLPNTPPHVPVDMSIFKKKCFWRKFNKKGKKTLLARYTSNYDCKFETDWWFCVLDKPFDISELNANRRRKINLGNKKFKVCIINPKHYAEALSDILIAANADYPKVNQLQLKRNNLINGFKNEMQENIIFYGAFSKEKENLCGYTVIKEYNSYIYLSTHKVIPEYEKLNINAALIYKIITDYNSRLSNDFYITDGERNILHITEFQTYLEKYFNFRKAYCYLNIKYRTYFKMFIVLLFPLKKVFKRLRLKNKLMIQIYGLLQMEEIVRKQLKDEKKKYE